MCGRYYIEPDGKTEIYVREAERRMQSANREGRVMSGEIFPSMYITALSKSRSGDIGAFPMFWGYRMSSGKLLINARSETASVKQAFRDSWQRRRCVIPCDYYYEWKRDDVRGPIKYMIRPKKAGIVYLAGIYRYEDNPKVPNCVILTKGPSAEISVIHDRMPVIFSEKTCMEWLSGKIEEDTIRECAESEMEYAAVV